MNELDPRNIVSVLMLVLITSSSLGIVVMATPLTVYTDREEYDAGEVVEIQGVVGSGVIVAILVERTLETIFSIDVTADEDGN